MRICDWFFLEYLFLLNRNTIQEFIAISSLQVSLDVSNYAYYRGQGNCPENC